MGPPFMKRKMMGFRHFHKFGPMMKGKMMGFNRFHRFGPFMKGKMMGFHHFHFHRFGSFPGKLYFLLLTILVDM